MQNTHDLLVKDTTDFPKVSRLPLSILQVNLGYLCNLSCTHCHVNAGPSRTELMDRDNIDLLLSVIKQRDIKVLDVTGGAPEMNEHFRYLVEEARKLNVQVIDRCNLTILFEEGYDWLPEFLAQHQVQVVASLPCYIEENVDKQRGKGVYQESVDAIKLLNGLGYGVPGSGLVLDLVYNPTGAYLPPAQESLEADYKRELNERFGLVFNGLLTITNMPISRFGAVLLAKGQFNDYMTLLRDNYSVENLASVMCRNIVSVDWQGSLYDCDFNQMLDVPLGDSKVPHWHLRDLLANDVRSVAIKVADHCFGCTAGQGSSCGGALN
ncbi:MAG: arsenosugar biosynthesis radical SAM (seleno)protein ArsS [Pseudomonadota bacterium]